MSYLDSHKGLFFSSYFVYCLKPKLDRDSIKAFNLSDLSLFLQLEGSMVRALEQIKIVLRDLLTCSQFRCLFLSLLCSTTLKCQLP